MVCTNVRCDAAEMGLVSADGGRRGDKGAGGHKRLLWFAKGGGGSQQRERFGREQQ